MLADNTLYIKKHYPVLYRELKKDVSSQNVFVEDARDGNKTLKIQRRGREVYVHSKYSPEREADSILKKFENTEHIDENTHVIFYGLGLGYHLDLFAKKYPNTSFSIYEPSRDVFDMFFSYKNINDYPIKNLKFLQWEYGPQAVDEFLNDVTNISSKKTVVIYLPVYENVFKREFSNFIDKFKSIVKNKRNFIHTNYAFQKRWTINSAVNFKEVLTTPNILMQRDDLFKDKTAILVAAGPSLNYEIENLRTIKEKGLAYIFSVGSAINTLIHHDIIPHAVCTYDPTVKNQMVFKKINELGIDSVPMIFGSSVGYEVLQQYKGPKYHMITNQDTISSYFLEAKDGREIPKVHDAPSIAIVTLELLYKLKFSTIVLVGQNLAYADGKKYAEGIDYVSNKEISQDDSITVKDVEGREVYTSDGFNRMRRQMEIIIKSFRGVEVINTTRHGAHIEGTKYSILDEVLNQRLTKGVADDVFYTSLKKNNYCLEGVAEKLHFIEERLAEYVLYIGEIKQVLNNIRELLNNRNLKQVEQMYVKLDSLFHKMESNDFFRVVVKPMSRVQYDVLQNKIEDVKGWTNPVKKAESIVTYYGTFIDQLYLSKREHEDVLNVLIESINTSDILQGEIV